MYEIICMSVTDTRCMFSVRTKNLIEDNVLMESDTCKITRSSATTEEPPS